MRYVNLVFTTSYLLTERKIHNALLCSSCICCYQNFTSLLFEQAMESLVALPKAIDYEWCPKSNEAQRLFVTVGEKGTKYFS